MLYALGASPQVNLAAEHNLALHHNPPTILIEKDAALLSTRLLTVCAIVILSLTAFWVFYGVMSKLGRSFHYLKLTLLCLSFASCSWGMNVLNKALVAEFKAPSLVTAAQMMMTVIGTLLLGWKELKGEFSAVLKWSLVPLLFFGMLVSSFFTYEYLTLSMLMVIRNLGPMVTLPIETVVMPADKKPLVTQNMVFALCVILIGAVLYGGHIQPSLIGFALALLNMLLAIADRVAQRRLLTSECKSLSTETCMLLNNLLGCFPTLALGAAMHEADAIDLNLWFKSTATVLLLLSGVIGSGICYFAIAVQREISATSFMVLQNSARIAVVFAGVALFHDPLDSVYQRLGLLLSFGGALWYGQTQLDANEMAKAAQKKEEQKPYEVVDVERQKAATAK